VAIAGEKVKSRLFIKTAVSPLKKRASSISSLAPGDWPAAQESKDVIVFETKGIGSAQSSDGVGGSACDVEDLATFENEAPGWEEYGYKKMLALMRRLPPSVYEHALRIRFGVHEIDQVFSSLISSWRITACLYVFSLLDEESECACVVGNFA
jgi:hypothetical protein